MEAKFTPGPWLQKNPEIGAIYSKADGGLVATTGYRVAVGSQEDDANAQLISQAPELFEVLKQIVHQYDQTYSGDCEGGYWKGAASIPVEVMERAKRLVGGAL